MKTIFYGAFSNLDGLKECVNGATAAARVEGKHAGEVLPEPSETYTLEAYTERLTDGSEVVNFKISPQKRR